jgi:hypothetical protein
MPFLEERKFNQNGFYGVHQGMLPIPMESVYILHLKLDLASLHVSELTKSATKPWNTLKCVFWDKGFIFQ